MKLKFFVLIVFFSIRVFGFDCGLKEDSKNLKDYNFVLVPGIFNEVLTFYFTEHRYYLINQGVPREQIHRINNSSLLSPEEESLKISDLILKINNDKPIVILAHSKGALESLYALGRGHSKVQKAFLIQSPLDGIGSYELSYDDKFKSHPDKNLLLSALQVGASLNYIKSKHEKFSKAYLRKSLQPILGKDELVNKLVFITTESKYEDLPYKFRLLGSLYQKYFGSAGDGVVLTQDQIPFELQGSGSICTLHLEGDHGTYVKAAPWRLERKERIYSFLDMLLL